MPRKPEQTLTALLPLTEISAAAEPFGRNLLHLATLAEQGLPVLDTAAWPGTTFRRYVDKRQRSEHEVAALIRHAHRAEHRQRCFAAQQAVRERALDERLYAEAASFAQSASAAPGTRLLLWGSLAFPNAAHVWHSQVFVSGAGRNSLEESIVAAFASAYDPELVRHAALAGVKSYLYALALGRLPPREPAERWLECAPAWPPQTSDGPPQLGGAVRDGAPGEPAQTWYFFGKPDKDAALEAQLTSLAERLPKSTGELCLLARGELSISSVSEVASVGSLLREPVGPGWMAIGESLFDVPTESMLSLIDSITNQVVRSFLAELGEQPSRRTGLVELLVGRPYLNLKALTASFSREYAAEARFLAQLSCPEPDGSAGPTLPKTDPRFLLPKLLASLTLSESRLRTRLREFSAEALQHQNWLLELDLAILPDDALRTTLREISTFIQQTCGLYCESKFHLVRALTALSNLASVSDDKRAPERTLSALAGLGDIASTQVCLDAQALAHSLARDPETLRALQDGARSVSQLPAGVAAASVERFVERHGAWPLSGLEVSAPRLGEQPGMLLALLASVEDARNEDVGYRARPLQARAQQHAESLAKAAGWLEKRALSALMARAAGFLRAHEELRLWLMRALGMLRTVILDAERRLRRLDPGLPIGAAWHLSLPEIAHALFNGRSDLAHLVSTRTSSRLRQLHETPRAPYLKNLTDPQPVLTKAGPRLHGCYTGSGSFTGTVVRLASLQAGKRRLGPDSVLVTPAVDGYTAILMGFAGATICAVGHPLCHVATVARELGIPTVLGLGAQAELLQDGERVFVDGDRGLVQR